MRTLEINKTKCWYSQNLGKEAVVKDGYKTGEWRISYSAPAELMANISPVTGTANVDASGVVADYDKVLVLDKDPGITETTVFFIDKEPEESPPYHFDYRVRRIARSLNFVSIALKKVRDE